jgi:carboxymethylenebutenolidase
VSKVIESEVKSLFSAPTFDRRAFVVTSLGAGFALAVLPVSARTITTPADGLVAGEVKIPVAGGEMVAYRAMPATGGNFPVILVVSEIWGAHEHIRDVARRFAKLGYFAVAPELFARQGDAKAMADVQALIRDIVAKTPDAQVMADLDAVVAYAKATGKVDGTSIGVTGFCWGGRIALMYAAHNPELDAAVAWSRRRRCRSWASTAAPTAASRTSRSRSTSRR